MGTGAVVGTSRGAETPKVLIVDDQPRNLDALEAMLEPLGCELVRAESADEALLCLLRHDFAAIVLDIRMPGMGGLELATVIKQRKRSQHVPILFLTAHMLDEDDVLRGYGVGGVDYLSKPINAEILRSKVGVFVDLFRKTRALGQLNDALEREVAERQQAQDALVRANQELKTRVRMLRDAREDQAEAEAASQAKDEFLAMLSHELRNPLNVIAGGMAILDAAGRQDERLARTRELVSKQVRHLAKLLDDLLDIARVTSGKIFLQRRALDLGETVARCLAALRDADRLEHHACRQTVASVWVLADETRIEQIVTNLVGNALKFTPKGGRIDVSVTAEGRDAVLCVQDDGIGMAPELLPRIFDLFVQADRSIDRSLGGLGLGLALVRRLTEVHGGTVVVASDGPGRGASFTIRLPRIAPPEVGANPPSAPRATEPKRILIVEDNADGREMLRTMLELQGHQVHEAVDGPEAIEQVRAVRPHVAIIDIGLPGMDGYTVARTIREDQRGQAPMRLIALTGYGTEQDRQRAADVGFDAHLTKPEEPDRLQALLD